MSFVLKSFFGAKLFIDVSLILSMETHNTFLRQYLLHSLKVYQDFRNLEFAI